MSRTTPVHLIARSSDPPQHRVPLTASPGEPKIHPVKHRVSSLRGAGKGRRREEEAEQSKGWLWWTMAMAMAMTQEEGGKERLRRACIDFLLQENYILTAFELLHELQEDGLVECATKLQLFFANSDMFPPEELAKMHALQGQTSILKYLISI